MAPAQAIEVVATSECLLLEALLSIRERAWEPQYGCRASQGRDVLPPESSKGPAWRRQVRPRSS